MENKDLKQLSIKIPTTKYQILKQESESKNIPIASVIKELLFKNMNEVE